MSNQPKIINRFVYFYSYDLEFYPNTYSSESDFFLDIQNKINLLDFSSVNPKSSPYLIFSSEGNIKRYVTFQNVDMISSNSIITGILVKSKYSGLPFAESHGILNDIPLDKDSGLAELTHFIIYPNQKILGVEYNYYGDRISQLPTYINLKFPNSFIRFEIFPLVNHNVLSLLNKIDNVSAFSLKVKRNNISHLSQINTSLKSAFEHASHIDDNAEVIELNIRKKDRKNSGFIDFINKFCLDKFLSSPEKEILESFNVDCYTENGKQTYNLLEEKLIYKVPVEIALNSEKSRSVDSVDMFYKINNCYAQNNKEICLN